MIATTLSPQPVVTFPDSWYLTLFAPKLMVMIYQPGVNDSRHALQPFLIGSRLFISNRARVAWCDAVDSTDIEPPWHDVVLQRQGWQMDELRRMASLMLQYAQAIPADRYRSICEEVSAVKADMAYVFGEAYDVGQLALLIEGNAPVASGRYEINGHSGTALFFKWGTTGGGCVLPLSDK